MYYKFLFLNDFRHQKNCIIYIYINIFLRFHNFLIFGLGIFLSKIILIYNCIFSISFFFPENFHVFLMYF